MWEDFWSLGTVIFVALVIVGEFCGELKDNVQDIVSQGSSLEGTLSQNGFNCLGHVLCMSTKCSPLRMPFCYTAMLEVGVISQWQATSIENLNRRLTRVGPVRLPNWAARQRGGLIRLVIWLNAAVSSVLAFKVFCMFVQCIKLQALFYQFFCFSFLSRWCRVITTRARVLLFKVNGCEIWRVKVAVNVDCKPNDNHLSTDSS